MLIFIFSLDLTQSVFLLGRVIGTSQGFYQNTGRQKHRKTHAHTYTHQPSIPQVGFELTVTGFEAAKTIMPCTARLLWPVAVDKVLLNKIRNRLTRYLKMRGPAAQQAWWLGYRLDDQRIGVRFPVGTEASLFVMDFVFQPTSSPICASEVNRLQANAKHSLSSSVDG
jgi:hypothetical protein